MKAKIPSLPLEISAMEYLRYGRQCHIVMRERGMERSCARPDVLGVTKERFMIEIEVKRTMSDFRVDAEKRHRRFPVQFMPHVRQLYYMVPPSMVEAAARELPRDSGLMTLHEGRAFVGYTGFPEAKIVVPAPCRRYATPMGEKQIWRLVKDMASTLVTAEAAAKTLRNKL